jgi:hypothetical protein
VDGLKRKVAKEDVTGGDDLGDSPVEILRTVTVMPNGTKNITETIMNADGSRTVTETVARPEKTALPEPGRNTAMAIDDGIYPDAF